MAPFVVPSVCSGGKSSQAARPSPGNSRCAVFVFTYHFSQKRTAPSCLRVTCGHVTWSGWETAVSLVESRLETAQLLLTSCAHQLQHCPSLPSTVSQKTLLFVHMCISGLPRVEREFCGGKACSVPVDHCILRLNEPSRYLIPVTTFPHLGSVT